jgi:WD40 repeat protein
VGALGFSDDSATIAILANDGAPLGKWDAATGAPLPLKGDDLSRIPFRRVDPSLSLDGLIESGEARYDRTTRTIEVSDAARLRLIASGACSLDGTRLVAAGGGCIDLVGLDEGRVIFTSTEREGPVGVYTLSPDGARFAYASHSGLVVRDAGAGRKLAEFRGSSSSVDALAFSLDGRRLAAAYGGGGDPLAVVVWDIAAPDERAATPCGHTQRVTDYGFSPGGKRIVSGSQDDSLILWDAGTGAQLKTLMHPTKDNLYPVGSCTFAARGKRVVSHDPGGLHVYDTRSGNEVWGLYASIVWSAVSPDGDTVFLAECGNSAISVHDAFTGEKKRTIGRLHPFDQIDSFALSPDGRRLATISGDFVRLYEWATEAEEVALGPHSGEVRDFAFSTDGSRLVATAQEEALIWNLTCGNTPVTLDREVESAWGPSFAADDSRIIAACHLPGSFEQGLAVWDGNTGSILGTIQLATAWALTPDGTTVALGVPFPVNEWIDYIFPQVAVELWCVAEVERRGAMEGRASTIEALSFSPDGSRLAARFNENAIVVWDVATGRRWFTYLPRGKPTAPKWSPDGRDILFGTTAGTVHLMRLEGQGHLPEEGRIEQPPAPTDDPALVQGVAVEDAGGA